MQLTFRALPPLDAPLTASPGELVVRLAVQPTASSRTGLTLTALRQGPAGFVRGEGPVERIIVRADPNLDDLLAAVVLEGQLSGVTFPADVPLAHYAAALAEGLNPSQGVPAHELIEGVFAHHRHAAGDPLTDPDRAARFLAGWAKLAGLLRPALLDPKIDPYHQSLLADRADFRTECQYLRNDRTVYERDVRNGQRWLFRLPDVKDDVPALRLNEPKSVLFKFWARSDPDAGGGGPAGRPGYQFLAVRWGHNDWFFSTDPLDRYHIGSLAEPLQAAEVKRIPGRLGPDRKDPDPWYDGHRHNYTIVRPPHDGTTLTPDEVWMIVVKWGQGRPVADPPPPKPATRVVGYTLVGLATAAVVIGAIILIAHWWPTTDKGDPKMSMVLGGGTTTTGAGRTTVRDGDNGNGAAAVTVARGDPSHEYVKGQVTKLERKILTVRFDPSGKNWDLKPYRLEGTADAPLLVWLTASSQPKPPTNIEVQFSNGEMHTIAEWKGSDNAWRTDPIRCPQGAGQGVTVVVPNPVRMDPGAATDHDLTLVWRPNPSELHLHTMSIGVANYDKGGPYSLCGPNNDATELSMAFAGLKGPLFTEVMARKAVWNATRNQILDELREFERQVTEDRSKLKLAIVTFSGHGAIPDKKHFIFLPRDYAGNQNNGIYVAELTRHLTELNCTTLLLLDACHSGNAALEIALQGARTAENNTILSQAVTSFADQHPGLFVLAGADRHGRAFEDGRHGALSRAVLEVLKGKRRIGKDGLVTLEDLYDYVKVEVPRRVTDQNPLQEQVIVPGFPQGRQAKAIPIAYFPPKGP